MLLFNRLGGGKFSQNTTPLSKIDESVKMNGVCPELTGLEGVTNRFPSAISAMVKFRSFLILFMFGTFSFFLSLFVSRDFFQVLLL